MLLHVSRDKVVVAESWSVHRVQRGPPLVLLEGGGRSQLSCSLAVPGLGVAVWLQRLGCRIVSDSQAIKPGFLNK